MSPAPSSPDHQTSAHSLVDHTFLQYRIVEKLGAGGMGEIYKARDTRLNRFVAIKVLTAGTAGDPERRRRFIHEAQAASALNHPNIVTIYDIVSDGETQYMVMEFIDGKTLGEWIPREGMGVRQVAKFAAQIADALSAAHSAGIVHRDLKPANIMVSGNGFVKLLDFGLAKMLEPELAAPDAETRTIAPAMTREGALVGTVNYMSPEQAEGKRLDARSDIFSFGSVLYEMLTGRRAFRGGSTVATLSAVLRDEAPPIAEVVRHVPAALQQLVARCMKKNPAERFQSMREIQAALAPWRDRPEPAASKWGSKGILFLIVLVALGTSGYWWTAQQKPSASSRPTKAESPSAPRSAAREVPSEKTPDKPLVSVTVPDGHPVLLTLVADIPKDASTGDEVSFKVAQDVVIEGTVVIRKDAPVSGTLTVVKKVIGRGITFRLKSVAMTDGQRAGLRATSRRGEGGSSRPAINGSKDLASTVGTEYVGYIDGDRFFGAQN